MVSSLLVRPKPQFYLFTGRSQQHHVGTEYLNISKDPPNFRGKEIVPWPRQTEGLSIDHVLSRRQWDALSWLNSQ